MNLKEAKRQARWSVRPFDIVKDIALAATAISLGKGYFDATIMIGFMGIVSSLSADRATDSIVGKIEDTGSRKEFIISTMENVYKNTAEMTGLASLLCLATKQPALATSICILATVLSTGLAISLSSQQKDIPPPAGANLS